MAVPAAHRPHRRMTTRLDTGRVRLALLYALISALLIPPAPAAETNTGLVLGVHPYLPYGDLRPQFEPFADRLSETLGREGTVRTGSSYEDHIREVGLDRVDIAFIGAVSEHPFLTRHGLPASTVTRLQRQLLSLRDDEHGRELLRSLHPHATGLVPVADDDYDNLRVLLHPQEKRP